MTTYALSALAAVTLQTIGASEIAAARGTPLTGASSGTTLRQLTAGPGQASIAFPIPYGGASVLYDQSSPPGTSGAYYVNADPPPDQAYASEGADDFEIADVAGWTVTEFVFNVGFVQQSGGLYTGTPNYNVHVYADAAGIPGDVSLCGGDDIPGTRQNPTSNSGPVLVTMPATCFLPAGHYWVGFSTIVVVPPSGLWVFNGAPAEVLDTAMWRNPGGALVSGCTSWASAQTCLGGFSGGFVAFNFQVMGSIGEAATDEIFANGFEVIP
ncbi:MAG: hypothetical protein ABIW82_07980 [Dokdonella sp.]